MLADTTSNLSQHLRKRHGITLGQFKARQGSGGGVPAPRVASRQARGDRAPTGHDVEVTAALVVKIDGRMGLWLPIEEVFNNGKN